MEPVILQAKMLTKSFKRDSDSVHVLRGINFSVHEKDCVAIMGASGAGKSTLLHLLGTLDRPTSGQVCFGVNQVDLWKKSDEELSRFRNETLGFVFQFHYLLPEFSAIENVMLPALVAGKTDRQARGLAKEILDFMGMGHRIEHRPAELSGGEQQRVAIARAVILKPKLILADELTGNLDSENGKKVMDLLLHLNQGLGIAVLIVTHDAEIARRIKRVYTMKDGELLTS